MSSGRPNSGPGFQAEPSVLLAGPTAVGKSEIALHLAQSLGAEIVSVDSMLVYRGMDIGTAKPSIAERSRVSHHLIDILDVSVAFDAGQFVRVAQEAVEGILSRGRIPLLCGGTGLYFKAFLHGLGDVPSADPLLRKQLETTPLNELLAELAERDPTGYQQVDRNNPRRIIRAVEVIRLTGKPFSQQRADWGTANARRQPAQFFALDRPSGELRERIDQRVERMFQLGLVAETQSLLERGLGENPAAMQALGYRQVAEHLRGARSLNETIELVKIRTRQFAKRQRTWFRRQLNPAWIRIEPGESAGQVADRLLGEIRNS